MRTSHGRVVWTVLLLCSTAAGPALLGQAKCPPVMAGLMPSRAANISGYYQMTASKGGGMGLGSAAADLETDPPCGNTNDKYPGHITIGITHYDGAQFAKHFQTQIESVEQEALRSERAELERKRPRTARPITTEGLTAGEGALMYFDYSESCVTRPGESYHAYLVGRAHNRDTSIEVKIDGRLSAAAARTAAREVMQNFTMARFSQVP